MGGDVKKGATRGGWEAFSAEWEGTVRRAPKKVSCTGTREVEGRVDEGSWVGAGVITMRGIGIDPGKDAGEEATRCGVPVSDEAVVTPEIELEGVGRGGESGRIGIAATVEDENELELDAVDVGSVEGKGMTKMSSSSYSFSCEIVESAELMPCTQQQE